MTIRFGIRVPLWRREGLTKRLLAHYNGMVAPLADQGVDLVLVAVSSEGPGYVQRVSPAGSRWIFTEHPNDPKTLGKKLTAGLLKMRDQKPDAILNIGSDDFMGIRTVRTLAGYASTGLDFCGFADFFYVHPRFGMKHWPGYPPKSRRADEPIGAGRMYSIPMLDALDWNLWPGGRVGRLDANTWGRVKELSGQFNIHKAPSEEVGPMVDVKGSESLTGWARLGPQNEDVPLGRARAILAEVGLEGLL